LFVIKNPYQDILGCCKPGHSMVTAVIFAVRYYMKISYRQNNEIKDLQFSYNELQRDYIQHLRIQIIEKSPNSVTTDRIKRRV
jgi:hypothetical protein